MKYSIFAMIIGLVFSGMLGCSSYQSQTPAPVQQPENEMGNSTTENNLDEFPENTEEEQSEDSSNTEDQQ